MEPVFSMRIEIRGTFRRSVIFAMKVAYTSSGGGYIDRRYLAGGDYSAKVSHSS